MWLTWSSALPSMLKALGLISSKIRSSKSFLTMTMSMRSSWATGSPISRTNKLKDKQTSIFAVVPVAVIWERSCAIFWSGSTFNWDKVCSMQTLMSSMYVGSSQGTPAPLLHVHLLVPLIVSEEFNPFKFLYLYLSKLSGIHGQILA